MYNVHVCHIVCIYYYDTKINMVCFFMKLDSVSEGYQLVGGPSWRALGSPKSKKLIKNRLSKRGIYRRFFSGDYTRPRETLGGG